MKIEIDIREMIRRALILLAGSALCALILVCLFSDIGTHTLFRIGVYLEAQKVDVGDTAYLEYYDVKARLNDTDSYRIFLDESVNGSYDAALDFLKFIKQNTDVNLICMQVSDPAPINGYLEDGDPSLLSDAGITGMKSAFLQKLYHYNQSLPPQKRVSVVNEVPQERCYILTPQTYDRAAAEDGVLDVSMIYPAREDCDPLFNVDTLMPAGCVIRFGALERLSAYVNVLEKSSGNFGMPEFAGVNQPDYYFIIENEAAGGDA